MNSAATLIIGRVLIGSAIGMALVLGVKMLFRQKEDVAVQLKEGWTRHRWIPEVITGILALWFVIDPGSKPNWLLVNWQYDWPGQVGLVLFSVGWTMRLLAQKELGRMWSEKIRLLKNHWIIRSGPYRYIRHPIYASYWVIGPGAFLISRDWALGIATLLYASMSWLRRLPEERMINTSNVARIVSELVIKRSLAKAEQKMFGYVRPETEVVITHLENKLSRLGVKL